MSKPTTTIATEREIRENVVYKVNVLYYMQAYENYTNAKDHYTREFYYNAKEQYKRVIHELDYLVYGRLG